MRSCLASLALILVACDGGSGGSCVIDSDCPSFLDVCIEGMCAPAGAVPESGMPPGEDAGEEMDAGDEEDAGDVEMDSGPPPDAAPMDAAILDAMPTDAVTTDAPVPTCPMPGPSWSVSFVSAPAACGDAAVGRAVSITPITGMPCQFNATSPAEPALSGSFGLDAAGMLLGTMSPGSAGAMTCSGTFNSAGPSFTIICGGACVINLSPL